jgi:hypothetical protein
VKRRILHILIALDQFIYVLVTLGRGMPDEIMSAAAWRGEQMGLILPSFFRPVIDFIFLPIERDHCRLSYESEQRRSHLPDNGCRTR